MFAAIGSVIVLGCVIAGFAMSGGHLLALWHPSEILIIVGAAFGAFVISNPMKVVKASFTGALALFQAPRFVREDYRDLLKLLYDILVKAVAKMALVASVRGYALQVAIEFARKLLFRDVRPTFMDLEAHLKGKT